ncbi:hypothetical protein [Paraburkholderia sp. MM5477-R1]|uniref:hypothetical protein n=1 Tax=Paraburkholderia sp. MM5477-R1 TaxID=2991062 RepID=UPI003D1A58FB
MKEEIRLEERLFMKADKSSEDLSCNWHYEKSPSFKDFASGDATGKWCIFMRPAEVDAAWTNRRLALEARRARLLAPRGPEHSRLRPTPFANRSGNRYRLSFRLPSPLKPLPCGHACYVKKK